MAVVLHTVERPEKKVHINQAEVSNKLWVILTHVKSTFCDQKENQTSEEETANSL